MGKMLFILYITKNLCKTINRLELIFTLCYIKSTVKKYYTGEEN